MPYRVEFDLAFEKRLLDDLVTQMAKNEIEANLAIDTCLLTARRCLDELVAALDSEEQVLEELATAVLAADSW